jgi:hypothetical protein
MNVPTAAADRPRRVLQMDAQAQERTSNNAVAARRCRENVVKEGTKGGRLRHRRRVRAAVPTLLCALLCRVPAGHQRRSAGSGSAPCGAAQRYPNKSLMDASAPAPSSAAIASAWPLPEAMCSGVSLWATAAFAAALARADPPPIRPRADPPHKRAHPLSWMSSGAPAWMSARTAGRWPWYTAQCSAVLPYLCKAKAGEGSVWPRG